MNKQTIFVLILLICTAGFIGYTQFVQPQLDNRAVNAPVPMQIDPVDLPISFTYSSGEAALALIEPPVTEGALLKKVYLLMDSQDYTQYSKEAEGTTPPPSISVFVLGFETNEQDVDQGRVTKLQNWAQANPQLSSWFAATTEPEVTDVDGATALRYQTEGTYKQEVYLVSYKKNIFVLTGQYEEVGDEMQQHFTEVMQTVYFD